jgi:two-component system chemotaxis response regulator CheY
MKILIVDDDKISREVLRKFIAAQPEHQVTLAADGEEGWALLDDPSRYFDVVFLDLTMPSMDGFELLKRIRQSPVHGSLEVVLCTGANDRATIAKAIQAGVRHYLVKPCTEAVVLAKLNQIRPVHGDPAERRLAGA